MIHYRCINNPAHISQCRAHNLTSLLGVINSNVKLCRIYTEEYKLRNIHCIINTIVMSQLKILAASQAHILRLGEFEEESLQLQ